MRLQRAVIDRLVIAGEESVGLAERRNAHRAEIVLEERLRLGVVERSCRRRAPADIIERAEQRPLRTHRLGALQDGRTAFEISGKGGGVIIVSPAIERREGQRLHLRAVQPERMLGEGRGGGDGEKARSDNPSDGPGATPRSHRPALAYCPASVATSFQLGSREDRSRAKVHTSVTSVTFSALPSTTLPLLSRVTETSCETKRTVICAVRPRSSAAVMSALSMETKRLSMVSPRVSRSVMAVSKPSHTSRESRFFSVRRSPCAKAMTIIS